MDSIGAALATYGVAAVPALFRLADFRDDFGGPKWMRVAATVLNVSCLVVQVTACLPWKVTPYLLSFSVAMNKFQCRVIPSVTMGEKHIRHFWALPAGLLLASFGWWEAFVSEYSKVKKHSTNGSIYNHN